jgi:hypothetical protein
VLAAPRLNAGFLICGNNELIVFQGLTFPFAGIQIQHASGFVGKVGIPRENPTPVIPGTDGILMEPAPIGTTAIPGMTHSRWKPAFRRPVESRVSSSVAGTYEIFRRRVTARAAETDSAVYLLGQPPDGQ